MVFWPARTSAPACAVQHTGGRSRAPCWCGARQWGHLSHRPTTCCITR